MTFLERLKVVTSVKPSNVSPVFHRRERLVSKLYEQIECAKAKIDGREHLVTYMKSYFDEAGEKSQSQQVRKVRPWWYRSSEGKLVFEVRYANKRIELAKGKTGIEVEKLENIIPAVETLIKAVQDGEVDSGLTAIASKFRADITK